MEETIVRQGVQFPHGSKNIGGSTGLKLLIQTSVIGTRPRKIYPRELFWA
jgi:hypothetical protein